MQPADHDATSCRILIVEDDSVQREVLCAVLGDEYEVLDFGTAEQALEAVRGGAEAEIALVDQRLPGMSGVALLSELCKALPQTVRLVLSGIADTNDVLAAINEGHAYRYVVKPWRAEELRTILRQAHQHYQLERDRAAMVEELQAQRNALSQLAASLEQRVAERTAELAETNRALSEALERITQLAGTDQLTGLANRRSFVEAATAEQSRVERYGGEYSLLLLDVDHFKQINDTHGHLSGDRVLCELAERMSRTVRAVDLVARHGGEEFAVLLPETPLSGALVVAERLRHAMAAQPFSIPEGEIPVSISVGAASSGGEASVEELTARADRFLYAAKEAGRNCVRGSRND